MKKIFGLVCTIVLFCAFSTAKAQGNKQSSDLNVYGENTAAKPVSPYANNSVGGFTVTKFKESKTQKKLRRGEARTRFSVPDPKGKPLKHNRRKKFLFFG